jgi:5-bromo-4-chloroindolyl phosphate hydrolysis protein
MSAKEITITLYENQLVSIIQMLEEVNAPLKVTRPIYDSIMSQIKQVEKKEEISYAEMPIVNGKPFKRG